MSGQIRANPCQTPQPGLVSGIYRVMPRFFFHIYNRTGDLRDDEGTVLSDPSAAHEHAVRGIRSLLSAEILTGELDLHGHLDIADAAGALVERTEFGDAVTIRPA